MYPLSMYANERQSLSGEKEKEKRKPLGDPENDVEVLLSPYFDLLKDEYTLYGRLPI